MDKYRFEQYDSRYALLFRLERRRLKDALGKSARIRHVGSTSIQGLGGKGIVDILLGAPQDEIAEIKQRLIVSGYEFRAKASTPQRLFFRRDFPDDHGLRRVHVHVAEYRGKDWDEMVRFREYLMGHPEAIDEYALIKKEGVEKAHGDGEIYRKHKEKFIKEVLKKANI